MQSAQNVLSRERIVILHESAVDSDPCHLLFVVTFKEESSSSGKICGSISKHPGRAVGITFISIFREKTLACKTLDTCCIESRLQRRAQKLCPARRLSFVVVLSNPLFVCPAGDIFHPSLVFQIPKNCLPHSAFKCFPWLPANLAMDLATINRVPSVVSRSVFHVGDQLVILGVLWSDLLQNGTNCPDDFKVGFLARPTNIVGFPNSAFGQD